MSKEISILVNARLQSSRVLSKMTRPFGGTTLLRIALEKLNKLSFAKHRFLCVAEEDLLQYAEGLDNIEVLWRDSKAVTKGDVGPACFGHYYKIPTDWFMFMNACHPFTTVETYQKAYAYFQNTDYNAYTSVTQNKDWIFDADGEPLTNKDPKNLGSKQGNYAYKANHAFHIVNKPFFMQTGYLHWEMKKDSPHVIPIPEEQTFDIDTETDFQICEYLYKAGFPYSMPSLGPAEGKGVNHEELANVPVLLGGDNLAIPGKVAVSVELPAPELVTSELATSLAATGVNAISAPFIDATEAIVEAGERSKEAGISLFVKVDTPAAVVASGTVADGFVIGGEKLSDSELFDAVAKLKKTTIITIIHE